MNIVLQLIIIVLIFVCFLYFFILNDYPERWIDRNINRPFMKKLLENIKFKYLKDL